MKKFKITMTLFLITLCLGGVTNVFASAFLSIDNYKADYLQTTQHYSSSVTKNTNSSQKVRIVSTTGSRPILIAEYADLNECLSATFISFDSGTEKVLSDYVYKTQGSRRLRFKLAKPWTQVTINGTWYYDIG